MREVIELNIASFSQHWPISIQTYGALRCVLEADAVQIGSHIS